MKLKVIILAALLCAFVSITIAQVETAKDCDKNDKDCQTRGKEAAKTDKDAAKPVG